MKRYLLLAACMFMPIISSCATMDNEDSVQQATAHFKIGVGHLSENKIQLAFVEFQRAYELNPNDKEVLNGIGIIYLLYFDETQKAVDFFQRAVRVDPLYSEAYNNLGAAQEKMGNYDAAIASYQKATSNLLYKTPEKAYVNKGRAYYRQGKFNEAVTAYKEAIKRAPNMDLPYLGLALCYNAMKRYGDASRSMTYAINLTPRYKGDPKLAAEDFHARRIVASGPELKDLEDYLEILKY